MHEYISFLCLFLNIRRNSFIDPRFLLRKYLNFASFDHRYARAGGLGVNGQSVQEIVEGVVRVGCATATMEKRACVDAWETTCKTLNAPLRLVLFFPG